MMKKMENNHFWFPKEPFSEQFLMEPFKILILQKFKEPFFHYKEPFMQWKGSINAYSWEKFPHGTKQTNKEPLLLRGCDAARRLIGDVWDGETLPKVSL